MKNFHPAPVAAVMLVAVAVLLIAAGGCGGRTPPVRVSSAGYLGSAACAGCHATEFNQHLRSRHAVTMMEAKRATLGKKAPPVGDIPGSGLVLNAAGAGYVLASKSDPSQSLPLQFALGSGKFGQTYIHIVSDDAIAELGESYQPYLHRWFRTPGQADPNGGVGRVYSGRTAERCLSCHTTTPPPSGLLPASQFYGVGCEACHGPGKAHIDAVRAGNLSDLHMEKIGKQGALQINTLCGRCHRLAKDVKPNQPATERFHSYRLMMSRCFLESGDTLSCLSCHNPHTDASTDDRSYERVCLSCHPAASPSSFVGPQPHRWSPCPVNPRSGCVKCHMPTRQLLPGEPVAMADHFIRVVRQGAE